MLAASGAAGASAGDGQLLEAPAASSEPESPDAATTTTLVETEPITSEAEAEPPDVTAPELVDATAELATGTE